MIQNYSDFSDIPLKTLPFIVLRPDELSYRKLSVRFDDEKWPTVWFIVTSGNREFRVKEFFMDWFFTGFPKSLFRDFSTSYSEVENIPVNDLTFFYGKNYHGLDSASGYYFGTQIEIECNKPVTAEEMKSIVGDLIKKPLNNEKLKDLQFPDRSHFTKGHDSDWFEDRRVSRLKWVRTPDIKLSISGHTLETSGIGFIDVDHKKHRILILQENGFQNAVWVEVTDWDIRLEHVVYDVRIGKGFYTESIEMKQERILYREPSGPGVLRADRGDVRITIGFSPGFMLADMVGFKQKIDDLEDFVEKVLVQSLQETE